MKTDAIASNPAVLGGVPVFRGTRVPVKNLIDYLEGARYPGVSGRFPFRNEATGHSGSGSGEE